MDGRFVTVNPALVEMLGYATPEALMAVEVKDLYVRSADRERLIEQIDREGHIRRVETEWKRGDGSPIGVALSGRVRRADDGAITGFEIMVEDITVRRDLENQLRQAQKMEAVGQLAGGVAHDFNNLLTTIIISTEMIHEQFPADSPLRAESDLVLRASKNAADLTRKLLTFGRRATLDLQPLLLAEAVEGLVTLARRVIPADIELVTRVRDLQAVVRADRTALEQVLMNLVTNARDAMPGGGTLAITVDRRSLDDDFRARHGWGEIGDYATITVSDTGGGMDAETMRRVFEPFFTTKAIGSGTGLGMAMVWGLVKQQRGFVNVYSEPGEGTAVTIYLPVAAGATAERLVAHQGPVGGTETILVAEDEPYIRQTIQRVLSRHGYRVLLASDGLEALAQFEEHGRDIRLLISDVVMPHLGGVDLVAQLRERHPQIKVLLMSGYMGRDLERLQATDATIPLLAKPWTVTDLLASVRTILDAEKS
jgi:PAS domain S-box-containing protein